MVNQLLQKDDCPDWLILSCLWHHGFFIILSCQWLLFGTSYDFRLKCDRPKVPPTEKGRGVQKSREKRRTRHNRGTIGV